MPELTLELSLVLPLLASANSRTYHMQYTSVRSTSLQPNRAHADVSFRVAGILPLYICEVSWQPFCPSASCLKETVGNAEKCIIQALPSHAFIDIHDGRLHSQH